MLGTGLQMQVSWRRCYEVCDVVGVVAGAVAALSQRRQLFSQRQRSARFPAGVWRRAFAALCAPGSVMWLRVGHDDRE